MKKKSIKLFRKLFEKLSGSQLRYKRVLPKGTGLGLGSTCKGTCSFGKYCAIGRDVKFIQKNHDYNKLALQVSLQRKLGINPARIDKSKIVVGNDVWIGDNAIILSGVEIGDGAVIGAGSVVTKEVEPYSIVAGVPAGHIKWRFPKETREFLLKLKWWDWPREKVLANRELFSLDWSAADLNKITIK